MYPVYLHLLMISRESRSVCVCMCVCVCVRERERRIMCSSVTISVEGREQLVCGGSPRVLRATAMSLAMLVVVAINTCGQRCHVRWKRMRVLNGNASVLNYLSARNCGVVVGDARHTKQWRPSSWK